MASYDRDEWSSNVPNYYENRNSNSSYQSRGYKQSSTNVEVESMANMDIQSIIPWEALSNNSNNIGSNYNVSSYSNNYFMGHTPTTVMNQYNQHDQSGTGQNYVEVNCDAQQNNSKHFRYEDRNKRNYRNYSSENRQSQTLVTVTEQFNRNSSFSKNKSFYSVKDHRGNKNGNKPLKRLGNNAHKSKLGMQNTNQIKNLIEYKNGQNPKAVKEESTENKSSVETKEDSDGNDIKGRHNNIPIEYLKCHICNHLNFNSVNEYWDHINGQSHANVAQIYNAKYRATLKLLRVDAALACQRMIDNDKSHRVGIKYTECITCQCCIPFNDLQKHISTTEHILVENYTNGKCCGWFFYSRGKFTKHKRSLYHLKIMGEREKYFLENIKDLELKDKSLQEDEDFKNKQILKDIRAKEMIYTASTLPAYDSQKAIGKCFVMQETYHYCLVCLEYIQKDDRKISRCIDCHCSSSDHYENLYIFLNDDLEKKPDRNNKKKGDITENKIIKEAVSSTEENSNAHKKSEKLKDNEDEKSIQGHDRLKENEEENIGEKDEEMLDIHEADNEILNENDEDDEDVLSNESLSEMDPFWDGFCHDIEEDVDRENEECMNETVQENKNQ